MLPQKLIKVLYEKSKLIAFIYWVIAIVLLTLPGNKFPKANWFSSFQIDKWVHIILFALLVLFSCLYFKKNIISARVIIVVVFCFLFGVIIEFVQEKYIPNRSFDKYDILADGIGCLVGLVLFKKSLKHLKFIYG